MSSPKRCIQCGILKEAEEFRPYSYKPKEKDQSRYSICRDCESINTQYRELSKSVGQAVATIGISSKDADSFFANKKKYDDIVTLYKLLEDEGLRTPLQRHEPIKVTAITKLTAFYAKTPVQSSAIIVKPAANEVTSGTPEELQYWLDAPTSEWEEKELSPEYLQETVYESLKAKYRPQTGVDMNNYIPVYDNTYKDILNAILRRFDEYEEKYIQAEEANLSGAEKPNKEDK